MLPAIAVERGCTTRETATAGICAFTRQMTCSCSILATAINKFITNLCIVQPCRRIIRSCRLQTSFILLRAISYVSHHTFLSFLGKHTVHTRAWLDYHTVLSFEWSGIVCLHIPNVTTLLCNETLRCCSCETTSLVLYVCSMHGRVHDATPLSAHHWPDGGRCTYIAIA